MTPAIHRSVMPAEIVRWLGEIEPRVVVDGTYGGGGHTRRMLDLFPPQLGRRGAIDRDPEVIRRAESEQGDFGVTGDERVTLFVGSYERIPEALRRLEIPSADVGLLDLGLSSDQLEDARRGFSFLADGPLDLRFDPESGIPAHTWLDRHDEREIADVIYQYGEERHSRRVAREIVRRAKERRPVRSVPDLVEICRRCVPRSKNHDIHPATRTFQALRIAVNDELGTLKRTLADAPQWLRPGGRLAVISFHSLEDRIVKNAFRSDERWNVLTPKPLRPGDEETADNPRSRSAKLRVAERRSQTFASVRGRAPHAPDP